ncbi:MAG: class I SAM-dependent methyltransferase [Myxococcales bacterium]|nr:class I SAM-dependent methyltransferase [Myxococcales bacterium]
MTCPACSSGAVLFDFETPRLKVWKCRSCGHRLAQHLAVESLLDYHQQYDQGAFVDSLRATRVRQARRILGWIREAEPAATRLLDYGCGRGWFLDEAKAAGWQVAGADSSPMAVQMLRDRGIAAVDLDRPIESEVVTLLDVIEHFTVEELVPRLSAVRARVVVIKVPTSEGLLYRFARGRALEQMYQVGTYPPHHHYFNRRSLRHVLARAGMQPLGFHRDRDFEPSTVAARAGLHFPLAGVAGSVAAAAAALLRMEDSLISLARPRAS